MRSHAQFQVGVHVLRLCVSVPAKHLQSSRLDLMAAVCVGDGDMQSRCLHDT